MTRRLRYCARRSGSRRSTGSAWRTPSTRLAPTTASRLLDSSPTRFASVAAPAHLAIDLHYRNSLGLACREGAFEAGLAGHSLADGKRAALDLWQKLEPSAVPITVSANQSALASVSLRGWAPAIVPVPI